MQTEEIWVIALIVGLLVLLTFCWLSDTYKGLQNCWKTPCDKYIWNPMVDLYYGLCCCHVCQYKKKDKVDDNYSKASTQEEFGIQMNHHPTNNDDKMSDYENENGTLERRNSRSKSSHRSDRSEPENSIGLR